MPATFHVLHRADLRAWCVERVCEHTGEIDSVAEYADDVRYPAHKNAAFRAAERFRADERRREDEREQST